MTRVFGDGVFSRGPLRTALGELYFSVVVPDAEAAVRIELFPVLPRLPSHMSVRAATAALLSLTLKEEGHDVRFECAWLEWPSAVDCWGSQSGEFLTCVEWTSGSHLVAIGTEDDEALEQRLPDCGFTEWTGFAVYDPHFWGLRTIVPVVPPNTEVSLHFIVVENDAPEPEPAAAWFAADLPHAAVLAQCPAPRPED